MQGQKRSVCVIDSDDDMVVSSPRKPAAGPKKRSSDGKGQKKKPLKAAPKAKPAKIKKEAKGACPFYLLRSALDIHDWACIA